MIFIKFLEDLGDLLFDLAGDVLDFAEDVTSLFWDFVKDISRFDK